MKLRLKEILGSRKMSISLLASLSGITQANMSNIVNEKASPSLDTLTKIANALSLNVSDLLNEKQSDGNSITCPNCGKRFKMEE